MERKEKFCVTHFLLLALTLAFLAALAAAVLRDKTVMKTDEYTVVAERSVPQEELAPEVKPLDINSATAEQLQTLMGIGPVLAQAIVDYRAEHGAFASVDELLEVSGIGETKLNNIRGEITVGEEDAA